LTRDVPGIDSAFLAMDVEEGVEVVWSEVRYSNRKVLKGSKVKDRQIRRLSLVVVCRGIIVNAEDLFKV